MSWQMWTLIGLAGWFVISFVTFVVLMYLDFLMKCENDKRHAYSLKYESFSEFVYDLKDLTADTVFSILFPIGWIGIGREFFTLMDMRGADFNIFKKLLKIILRKRYLLNRVSKEI